MADADSLILHHFNASPFSEKIRLVMGLKGLNWVSVTIPAIMPKPDLTPLTGGYRRTPVLQIGADIYCDTQLILREIERRHPSPTLYPNGEAGLAWMIAMWADRAFFQAGVPIIFGAEGFNVPEAFKRDREQLSGRPFDTEQMRAASPMMYSFCVRELETPRIRESGYFSAIQRVNDPQPQPSSRTRCPFSSCAR